MSYIGNGRTLVILGTNVRDDIVPTYSDPYKKDGAGNYTGELKQYPEDGDFDKQEFDLSQEVPGGYEQNALVLRQKYITDELIQNTTTVNIVVTPLPDGGVSDTFKIVCNNATVSSTLAIVREKMKFFSGSEHKITISGSAVAKNNNTFTVVDVAYIGNGTSVEITLNRIDGDLQTSTTGETLTFTYSYTSPWEVLNPESDYKIVGNNKIIQFKDPPQFNDQLYVVHRGEATYNLVPSPNSVGPDQLSHNLRNFVCDRYEGSVVSGVGVKTFALSQGVVNSKAILVTVDGVVKESDYDKLVDNSSSSLTVSSVVTVPGDWKLDETLNGDGKQTITFATAPDVGAKIRVLHLGFSTVSRREVLSPGQIGGLKEDAVGTSNIRDSAVTTEKIANDAVTTSKLAANSVTDVKILLDNNKSLRAKKDSGVVTGLIKLDLTNVTTVEAETQASVTVNGVKKHNFTATEISPETTNEISLGTSSKRFKDLNLSGVATVGLDATTTGTTSLNVKGDIAVNGTVDGVDVSALKTAVEQLITDLPTLVNNAVPVGTMMMWSGGIAPNDKWLPCDGRPLNRVTYSTLFEVISTNFGAGDNSTTFNLPDMRRRFAIGALTKSELGNNEAPTKATPSDAAASARTITHTHTGAVHTHDLSDHTHIVPGHNHAVDVGVAPNNSDRFRTIEVGSGAHQTTIDIGHGHPGSVISRNTTGINISDDGVTANNKTESKATGLSASQSVHGHNFHHLGSKTDTTGDRSGSTGEIYDSIDVFGVEDETHQHDLGKGAKSNYRISSAPEVDGPSGGNDSTNWFQIKTEKIAPIINVLESAHYHTAHILEPSTTVGTNIEKGHNHSVTVASYSGSKSDAVTDGKHKHDYTDFAGKIGKLTTYTRTVNNVSITPSNGDGDFSTSTPSNNTSGPANYSIAGGGTNVSGASVSPYLTVNYLIKVL